MTFGAKFHRAVEQMNQLEATMDAWIATNPYTVASHEEIQSGEVVVTAMLREEPPTEWALRIGECLYNFRSGLDQLAFELAERHTGTPLPAKIADMSEFPIFGRRPPSAKELADKIGGIDPKAQAIIQALQPHHRGNPTWKRDSLAMLDRLCNLDKHRALHLVPLSHTGVQIQATVGSIRQISVAKGPIHHGAEVMRWAPETPKVEVQFALPFFVCFSESSPAEGQPVVATLQGIAARIRSIFSSLAEFLR